MRAVANFALGGAAVVLVVALMTNEVRWEITFPVLVAYGVGWSWLDRVMGRAS